MEWVGGIRCEKYQNDFMAQTCALIAPKYNEMHQNMSLGYNGVD